MSNLTCLKSKNRSKENQISHFFNFGPINAFSPSCKLKISSFLKISKVWDIGDEIWTLGTKIRYKKPKYVQKVLLTLRWFTFFRLHSGLSWFRLHVTWTFTFVINVLNNFAFKPNGHYYLEFFSNDSKAVYGC
jgi:hypothetical protein